MCVLAAHWRARASKSPCESQHTEAQVQGQVLRPQCGRIAGLRSGLLEAYAPDDDSVGLLNANVPELSWLNGSASQVSGTDDIHNAGLAQSNEGTEPRSELAAEAPMAASDVSEACLRSELNADLSDSTSVDEYRFSILEPVQCEDPPAVHSHEACSATRDLPTTARAPYTVARSHEDMRV